MLMQVKRIGWRSIDFWDMKVTLMFPNYLQLSGFIAVAQSGDIEMNLRTRSLTAFFSDQEIRTAIEAFSAVLVPGLQV